MLRYIALLGVMGLLSACAHTPPKQAASASKTIVVLPSDSMIPVCQLTPPPEKKEFIRASKNKQLDLLATNDAINITHIGDCNTGLNKLRDWKSDQKKKYKDDPDVTIQE